MKAKENYEIPSVPTTVPNLDQTGLKNLAGWIARYKKFGLEIDEVSSFVSELLDSGTLAQFEPSLVGLRAGHSAGDEEYDRYEFDARIEQFVDFGEDWAMLHFSFQANNKCMMFIEDCDQSGRGKLGRALERIFNAIEVDPLTEEDSSIDITWEEADEVILRYVKYMNNPEVPSVPE